MLIRCWKPVQPSHRLSNWLLWKNTELTWQNVFATINQSICKNKGQCLLISHFISPMSTDGADLWKNNQMVAPLDDQTGLTTETTGKVRITKHTQWQAHHADAAQAVHCPTLVYQEWCSYSGPSASGTLLTERSVIIQHMASGLTPGWAFKVTDGIVSFCRVAF